MMGHVYLLNTIPCQYMLKDSIIAEREANGAKYE